MKCFQTFLFTSYYFKVLLIYAIIYMIIFLALNPRRGCISSNLFNFFIIYHLLALKSNVRQCLFSEVITKNRRT